MTTLANGGAATASLVAGVLLSTRTERAADDLAHRLAARLDMPAAAADITAASHSVHVNGMPISCLSVEILTDDPDTIWRMLLEALPTGHERPPALCVGNRRAGPDDLHRAAVAAAQAHRTQSSGRAIHFPGVSILKGTMSVRDIVTSSAIDSVRVLAGGEADPHLPVMTRDHVRPLWCHGQLVLFAQPAVGGMLVPFESPTPTPCCADHD